jgi:hypothetical protein
MINEMKDYLINNRVTDGVYHVIIATIRAAR